MLHSAWPAGRVHVEKGGRRPRLRHLDTMQSGFRYLCSRFPLLRSVKHTRRVCLCLSRWCKFSSRRATKTILVRWFTPFFSAARLSALSPQARPSSCVSQRPQPRVPAGCPAARPTEPCPSSKSSSCRLWPHAVSPSTLRCAKGGRWTARACVRQPAAGASGHCAHSSSRPATASCLCPTVPRAPARRRQHARRRRSRQSAEPQESLILAGFVLNVGCENDLWKCTVGLDGVDAVPTWEKLEASARCQPRYGHSATYLLSKNKIVYFGGQDQTRSSTTWACSTSPPWRGARRRSRARRPSCA